MPYIQINNAALYYETFGVDQPDRAPLVLIHGSTVTGQADWAHLAPFLARHYRVIVPDCRGHGRSSNPRLSYSFREMADDVAALVRALGYEQAHIIGHSNGGNVALVTLMEHPEVVQSCIPQAANAYVSQDIIDKEPNYFDPQRIERDNPAWMNTMIELHGPTHGPEYWRTLVKITCDETIAHPNYTAAMLQQVYRPVLVIQGEQDVTNAASGHGEFMAQHIPYAEFWSPKGIGHNVHLDLPTQWLEKVLNFLQRRGDEANEALHRLKQTTYNDKRETIFEVRSEGGVLTGFVLYPEQRAAAARAGSMFPAHNRIRVLWEAAQWALVNRNVASVYSWPENNDIVTQALMGDAVQILESLESGWGRVRLERDGYLGWMRLTALYRCSEADVRSYQESATAVVVAEMANVVSESNLRVGKLPFGIKFKIINTQKEQSAIQLPDTRICWIKSSDLLPLNQKPKPNEKGIEATLQLIKHFIGIPYFWGGLSPFGYDCSGLGQTFHAFLDLAIPRDADQQFRAGQIVEEAPRPGDLLFFGANSKITHVAISLGGDDFIHASGGGIGITYNSLNSTSPVYSERLKNIFVGARRFFNHEEN